MLPQLRKDDAAYQKDSCKTMGRSEIHREPDADIEEEIRHSSVGVGDRLEPLTIWIYRECYVRFSPIDYDIKKISNKYMHLTNNAVVSKSEQFKESEIDGNMWSCEELSDHL